MGSHGLFFVLTVLGLDAREHGAGGGSRVDHLLVNSVSLKKLVQSSLTFFDVIVCVSNHYLAETQVTKSFKGEVAPLRSVIVAFQLLGFVDPFSETKEH